MLFAKWKITEASSYINVYVSINGCMHQDAIVVLCHTLQTADMGQGKLEYPL